MFEDWRELRYHRDGDRLVVRPPRASQAGAVASLFVVVLIWLAAASDEGGGLWGTLGLVAMTFWAGGIVWFSVRARVVADREGVTLHRWGVRHVPWSEVRGFSMKPGYRAWQEIVMLRIDRTEGGVLWILLPSARIRVEDRVRSMRELGRRLSAFAEEVGAGPRPWPERVRVGGDPVTGR